MEKRRKYRLNDAMSEITAIETQAKRGDRKSIFVDGQFVVGAHQDVVAALNLAVGQRFEADHLEKIIHKESARKAFEAALRLIGYRDRAEAEVRKRLRGNDFPENIVDEVIDRLYRMGLLDDAKFSRDWVKSRTASKPMGRMRLAWELRTKGVEPAVVEQALENIDAGDERTLALALARNRADKSDVCDRSFRDKTASFLRRRGFGWGIIANVLDEICPLKED
ncbi:MAG: regulatory protein RecX [Armatimonadetes bacterium]|jgi:regulatory protein|nr:regulatory protein RecX [Armatimonadota bacterium]